MNKNEHIFTIGDKTNNGTISKFEVDSNGIRVFFEEKPKNYHVSLNSIKHIKQPLFTTEDGVDIFEGDVVTVVSLKDFEKGDCDGENDTSIEAYSITWEDKIISSCNWNLRKDNFLQFSTKEKAEEYILMNKPCLSLADVATVYKGINKKTNHPSSQANQLKKLVKSKLK